MLAKQLVSANKRLANATGNNCDITLVCRNLLRQSGRGVVARDPAKGPKPKRVLRGPNGTSQVAMELYAKQLRTMKALGIEPPTKVVPLTEIEDAKEALVFLNIPQEIRDINAKVKSLKDTFKQLKHMEALLLQENGFGDRVVGGKGGPPTRNKKAIVKAQIVNVDGYVDGRYYTFGDWSPKEEDNSFLFGPQGYDTEAQIFANVGIEGIAKNAREALNEELEGAEIKETGSPREVAESEEEETNPTNPTNWEGMSDADEEGNYFVNTDPADDDGFDWVRRREAIERERRARPVEEEEVSEHSSEEYGDYDDEVEITQDDIDELD